MKLRITPLFPVKRFAAMAAACVMLVSVAACGSKSDSGATVNPGEAIISVNNTEPQSPLVPADTNEMGGGKVIRYLFEGLVSYDVNGKQHLEVAKSITPNDDASQFTIVINDGWKFTNGEAVTASSFADAWSYAANVKHAMKQASRMSIIKGYDELQDPNVSDDAKLSGLEVKDDHTLVVTLNHSDSVFPVQLAHQSFFPLPSVAYKDIKAFGKNPIGNGPYKLKSWDVSKSITVVKNPDYKGSRTVKNGGIEFRVYTDEDSAYADVLAGNLDVLDAVPPSAVKTFRTAKNVTAYSQAGSTYQGFVIPERLDHFGFDEEGQLRRQAISMAINRKQIVDKVFSNTKTVATDFTSPLVPEYSKDLKGAANLEYNPEEAKKLWAQANKVSPWSGDFKIAYNADGSHKAWVDAVANQIKNTLGINAEGDSYPTFSDIRDRVTDRTIATAFRSGWMLDYPSAEDYLTPLYSSASADGHGSNDGDYKSPKFDQELADALSQTDESKRTAALQEAQETLLQDLLDSGAISGSTVVIWDYAPLLFDEDFASFLFYPVDGSPASFTSFKLDKVTVNGLSCQTLQVTTPEEVSAYLASIGYDAGGFGYVEITYDEDKAQAAATEHYTDENGKNYPLLAFSFTYTATQADGSQVKGSFTDNYYLDE